MSHTTTAATSAERHHPLSFATWLPTCLADDLSHQGSPPIAEEPTPRLDVAALCRRTFVHLESASPLARLSQSELLRSFRDFSVRIQEKVQRSDGTHQRRHTLTSTVIEGEQGPEDESPVRVVHWQLSTTDSAQSPLARMLKRRGLDTRSKDDSYTPNLKRCPSDILEEASALQQSRELSTRMSEALLNPCGDAVDRPLCQLELGHLVDLGRSLSSDSSFGNGADATPTPVVDYTKGLFFPTISPTTSPLLTSEKELDLKEPPSLPRICNTPVDSCGTESAGARSPSKLRPLADLLDTPWQQDAGEHKEISIPSTQPPTPRTPGDGDCHPLRHLPGDCTLKEWVATLPVHLTTDNEEATLHDALGQPRICRGSLSHFITNGLKPSMVSIFTSTVAQPLISAAPIESRPKDQSTAPKSEESVANCGHPNGCKPCAFFWSKGCLNGDDCRFCHEWHAPKRKKPMKDQKNLMIIAREDGKIAFLRCAAEDILKHRY